MKNQTQTFFSHLRERKKKYLLLSLLFLLAFAPLLYFGGKDNLTGDITVSGEVYYPDSCVTNSSFSRFDDNTGGTSMIKTYHWDYVCNVTNSSTGTGTRSIECTSASCEFGLFNCPASCNDFESDMSGDLFDNGGNTSGGNLWFSDQCSCDPIPVECSNIDSYYCSGGDEFIKYTGCTGGTSDITKKTGQSCSYDWVNSNCQWTTPTGGNTGTAHDTSLCGTEPSVTYEWVTDDWGECKNGSGEILECGTGVESRGIQCRKFVDGVDTSGPHDVAECGGIDTRPDWQQPCDTGVSCTEEAPVCNISASSTQLNGPGNVTIEWSATNSPTDVSVSGGSLSSTSASDSKRIYVRQDTTFTISASNDGGSCTPASVEVRVLTENPQCKDIMIEEESGTPNDGIVAQGYTGDITLVWNTYPSGHANYANDTESVTANGVTIANDHQLSGGSGRLSVNPETTSGKPTDYTVTVSTNNGTNTGTCVKPLNILQDDGNQSIGSSCSNVQTSYNGEPETPYTITWNSELQSDYRLYRNGSHISTGGSEKSYLDTDGLATDQCYTYELEVVGVSCPGPDHPRLPEGKHPRTGADCTPGDPLWDYAHTCTGSEICGPTYVPPNPTPPTNPTPPNCSTGTFNASPRCQGTTPVVDLSWSIPGATSVRIPNLGNAYNYSSPQTDTSPNTSYTLTAYNNDGQCNKTINNVTIPNCAPTPSCTITPATQSIALGERAELDWAAHHFTPNTINVSPDDVEGFALPDPNQNVTVKPTSTGVTTYTITLNQNVQCSATVNVTAPTISQNHGWANCNETGGYACMPDLPDAEDLKINVYAENAAGVKKLLGSPTANVDRPDLASRCGGDSTVGLKYNLPNTSQDGTINIRDGGTYTISTYVVSPYGGNEILMNNSERAISGCELEPTCTLSFNPDPATVGQPTQMTITTTDFGAPIDGGIEDKSSPEKIGVEDYSGRWSNPITIPVTLNGSPTTNVNFDLTDANGRTVKCAETVTTEEELTCDIFFDEEEPFCTGIGETATLRWESTGAESVLVDRITAAGGYHEISRAKKGAYEFDPSASSSAHTITAIGANGTQCKKGISLNTENCAAPTCDALTINKDLPITEGANFTLLGTGANFASYRIEKIAGGIASPEKNENSTNISYDVNNGVTENTTYRLTVFENADQTGQSDSCDDFVVRIEEAKTPQFSLHKYISTDNDFSALPTTAEADIGDTVYYQIVVKENGGEVGGSIQLYDEVTSISNGGELERLSPSSPSNCTGDLFGNNYLSCNLSANEEIVITYSATVQDGDSNPVPAGNSSDITNTARIIGGESRSARLTVSKDAPATCSLFGPTESVPEGGKGSLQWVIQGVPDEAHITMSTSSTDIIQYNVIQGAPDFTKNGNGTTGLLFEETTYYLYLDDPDEEEAPDCQVTIPIEADPNDDIQLKISKNVSASRIAPGQWITYTLSYNNDGTDTAEGAMITDDYAESYFEGESIEVLSKPDGVNCTPNSDIGGGNKALVCQINIEKTLSDQVIRYRAKVKNNISSGNIPNTVRLDHEDQSLTDSESVEIVSGVVTLSKNVSDTTPHTGQVLIYTVEIYNGTLEEKNLLLEDILQEGSNKGEMEFQGQKITFVPSDAGIASGSIGDGSLQINRFKHGGRMTIEYSYVIRNTDMAYAPATSSFTNTARISSENLSQSVTVTLTGPDNPGGGGGSGGGGGGGSSGGRSYNPAPTMGNDPSSEWRETNNNVTIEVKKYVLDQEGTWQDADTTDLAALIDVAKGKVEYKVVVSNTGNKIGKNIVLEDVFTSNAYLQTSLHSVGGASYNAEEQSFTVDTIEARGEKVFTYSAKIERKTGGSGEGHGENTIVVRDIKTLGAISPIMQGGVVSVNGINNTDRANIKGSASIRTEKEHVTLKKTVNKEYAKAGEVIEYSIVLFNRGETNYEDITITDHFPFDKADLLSAPGMRRGSGGMFTFHRAELKAGEIWIIPIRAQLHDKLPENTRVLNSVSISAPSEHLKKLRAEALTIITKEEVPETVRHTQTGLSYVELFFTLMTSGLLFLFLGWRRWKLG